MIIIIIIFITIMNYKNYNINGTSANSKDKSAFIEAWQDFFNEMIEYDILCEKPARRWKILSRIRKIEQYTLSTKLDYTKQGEREARSIV